MTTSSGPSRVLVAGATGTVGARVIERLCARGERVRALTRDPARVAARDGVEPFVVRDADLRDAAHWQRALEGCDAFVSSLGASVAMNAAGRASYFDVDVPIHAALAQALRAAHGVRAGVYVSVHPAPGYEDTRYVRAHLEVERTLQAALPALAVVRPTGIFSALTPFVDFASRGVGFVIGDGTARTNPIHPDDVADAVVRALDDARGGRAQTVAVGGPEVLTRARIVEQAFAALGRAPRVRRVPAGVMRAYAAIVRPFHPRLGDLIAFATAVSTSEGIAPQVGTRTLVEAFAQHARARALPAAPAHTPR